jgi:nicotinamidase-related amidase
MVPLMMHAERSMLVAIDLQARLMPHIAGAPAVVANAQRLIAAADLLKIPVVATEHYAEGIGASLPELGLAGRTIVAKTTFGSCDTPAFLEAVNGTCELIVMGCETHVCVLQTVLGLLERERRVFVVQDATASRHHDNKAAALTRMARHGAEIVTTEMVVFEWLGRREHPQFKAVFSLIK